MLHAALQNKVGRIAVLSLGTGLYTSSAESNTKNSGKAQWAQKLFGILMSAGTELNEAIVDELYYNQQNDLKVLLCCYDTCITHQSIATMSCHDSKVVFFSCSA